MKKPTDETPESLTPEQTFNGNLTARPKPRIVITEALLDTEGPSEEMDYGEMNLEDAIESGYTDENGHAIEMAKPDKKGSPTGALTDVGAGRSSVVHKHR